MYGIPRTTVQECGVEGGCGGHGATNNLELDNCELFPAPALEAEQVVSLGTTAELASTTTTLERVLTLHTYRQVIVSFGTTYHQ